MEGPANSPPSKLRSLDTISSLETSFRRQLRFDIGKKFLFCSLGVETELSCRSRPSARPFRSARAWPCAAPMGATTGRVQNPAASVAKGWIWRPRFARGAGRFPSRAWKAACVALDVAAGTWSSCTSHLPPRFGCVLKKYLAGKDPYGPVAQGIEQQPSKLKVAGSNPAGVANKQFVSGPETWVTERT